MSSYYLRPHHKHRVRGLKLGESRPQALLDTDRQTRQKPVSAWIRTWRDEHMSRGCQGTGVSPPIRTCQVSPCSHPSRGIRTGKAPGDLLPTPSSLFFSTEEEIERQGEEAASTVAAWPGLHLWTEKQRKVNLCCFWKLSAFSPFLYEMSLSIPDPLCPSKWLMKITGGRFPDGHDE